MSADGSGEVVRCVFVMDAGRLAEDSVCAPEQRRQEDLSMGRNKRLAVRIEEEWFNAISGLAGTTGGSAEDVALASLPDPAVAQLFFQCRDYRPDLRWDQISQVGRAAIRQHLRAQYMEGLEQHLARLGVRLEETSGGEMEAARARALEEIKADTVRPLGPQLAQAQVDSVYLGYLYEAWKRAQAGQTGYSLEPVETATVGAGGNDSASSDQWVVLKDGRQV